MNVDHLSHRPEHASGNGFRMTLATILMLLLLLAGFSAQARVLYVDVASGNDSTNYSQNDASRPWASIGRAVWGNSNRNNPNSSEAAQGGDTVIVRAGTYATTQGTGERYDPIYNPINSGSAGNEITIRADGLVTLQSNTSGRGEPIIGTYGRSYVTWDGFYINEINVNTRDDTGPVVVWQSENVTIQNVTIDGYNYGWADNHNGIRLEYTDNITLRSNIIRGYSEAQWGMNASAIMTYHTARAIIENNEIGDANTGIFIKGMNTGPITIRFNHVSNVQKAIIFGGMGTESASNGAEAYSNIIEDAYAGFVFIGYDSVSPANITVANNTIVNISGGDGGGILFRPEPTGYRNLQFYNNVIADSDTAITAWHGDVTATTFAHNNYHSNSVLASMEYSNYSLADWQDNFGKDTIGSTTNSPDFVNPSGGDYHLAASSALRSAGQDYLDLNNDGDTSDSIAMGAYATGNEVIGVNGDLTEPPTRPAPPILE